MQPVNEFRMHSCKETFPAERALVQPIMIDERQTVVDLIQRMADAARMDLTGLAKAAGLAPSTLTRFINGDSKFLPSTSTLLKLSQASGVPLLPNDGAPIGKMARAEAVAAVAKALEIGVGEAAALADAPSDQRLSAWLRIILELPPEAEAEAFRILEGFAAGHRAAKLPVKQPSEPFPGKIVGRTRRQ